MPDALEGKPRRNITRKVMLGLVVLLFLMRLGAERRPKAPDLAADCAKPAFKVSAASVRQSGPVAYRIVGPNGRDYRVGVDIRTWERRADGVWTPVPKPGYEGTYLAELKPAAMKDCAREGLFALPVPVGTHTMTLYELTERGPLFVAEEQVEVTED